MKYAHQQKPSRSLRKGKGSMLKGLWERRVTSFLASKQAKQLQNVSCLAFMLPDCTAVTALCFMILLLVCCTARFLPFGANKLILMLAMALTLQVLLLYDWHAHSCVCPQEQRKHGLAWKVLPSAVPLWWQLSALRLLCGQGRCSKGYWQVPYIHSKLCTLTCKATIDWAYIHVMACQWSC